MIKFTVFLISINLFETSSRITSQKSETVPYQLRCTNTNLLQHDVFETYKSEESYLNSIHFLESGRFTFGSYFIHLRDKYNWAGLSEHRKYLIESSLLKYINSLDHDDNGIVEWMDFLAMNCDEGVLVDEARKHLQELLRT